jgi:hypothetical protein
MPEISISTGGFTAYDYKEMTASPSMEPVYVDGLRSFGWELDNTAQRLRGLGAVGLRFKRDRRIRNKAELSRLQRQFEAQAAEIEGLESSKAAGATVAAFTVGLVGCAFLAGSVFAMLAELMPLMVVLGVPGFVCWVLPYLLYKRMLRQRISRVTPIIEAKYDELYATCESGMAMLASRG